ncbi:hypothetical protein Acid345_4426 [Candidatus Koribacter versatilis Ellin345]|uniref:ADP-ribosylation/crystallin J1 n=1 Tax=Koribacter versatilis (strain Ellin345) TaxID=204669 RepID=Q1II74_KORVE|nr:hypothetical protein [Candidatus Koribacter versatilis]ABF43426.1 hypothetical protein Acid345_4426 [Candidatus Koribacter versatilis Ellin345]
MLTIEYARQIARDWNTRHERSGYAGYVLRFAVDTDFLSRYEIQRAGSDAHLEYWIPAEEMEEFSVHIVGDIEVLEQYTGALEGECW